MDVQGPASDLGGGIDAIVIGGSYAGLSAAMQLARARRRVCVIDAGRPRNRFAATSHGFFGHDGAPPSEMIAGARDQLLAYPTATLIAGEAVAIQARDGQGFAVTLASGEQVTGSGVVLAHGVQDVLPGIPGVAERWGASVLHCPYCHGYEFAGRRLGVLYVNPTSSLQARFIADWGPTTLFLNGHDEIDGRERERLRERDVTIEPAPVIALEGEGTSLGGVRLEGGRVVAVEALFTHPGRQLGPLAGQLGCALDEGPHGLTVRIDAARRTTVPGVFAAGDVTTAAGNATLAAADGVLAGTALHRWLGFGDEV